MLMLLLLTVTSVQRWLWLSSRVVAVVAINQNGLANKIFSIV